MAFVPFTETDRPTMAAFNEKFAQVISAAVGEAGEKGLQIEEGSYVGTGSESGGTSVTLSIVPVVLFVNGTWGRPNTSGDSTATLVPGTNIVPYDQSVSGVRVNVTVSEKTMTWTGESYPDKPGAGIGNVAGRTYTYLAIGHKEAT